MARKSINAKKIALEFTRSLTPLFQVERAYLFGSSARGEMRQDSDVDMIILSRDFLAIPFMERLEQLNQHRTGSALNVSMDIIGLTAEEFKEFRTSESRNLRQIYREAKRVYP